MESPGLTSFLHFLPLSRSHWNAASHSCGTFLFCHGCLHSLLEMKKSTLPAKDWMATSWARTHLFGCRCWSMLWNRSRIAQPMKPCGPVIKNGPVLPPSGDWEQHLLPFSVCTTDMKGIQNLCHTEETHGIFLLTNTVVCLFAEGCKRWKGSLCIVPYTCIQRIK